MTWQRRRLQCGRHSLVPVGSRGERPPGLVADMRREASVHFSRMPDSLPLVTSLLCCLSWECPRAGGQLDCPPPPT